MLPNVFDFTSYKSFLKSALDSEGFSHRGAKSEMARAMDCHLTYFSQALNSAKTDISLEQADKLAAFLGLAGRAAEFFLCLVSCERAGTASLKARFSARMKELLAERTELENRLETTMRIPAEIEAAYFGAWQPIAIHVALSIPGLRQPEAIARRLGLPVSRVVEVLDQLCAAKLARRVKDRYESGSFRFHIGSDSRAIVQHHINWRLQCLDSIGARSPEDLHYSSVSAIARKDAEAIREMLTQAIERVRSKVRDSAEEDLFCYSVDLFRVREGFEPSSSRQKA